MMTFKNAGSDGPNASDIRIRHGRREAVYSIHGEMFEVSQDGVEFRVNGGDSVILNPDQVRELHRQLGDWLTLRSPIQKITMIDGISI